MRKPGLVPGRQKFLMNVSKKGDTYSINLEQSCPILTFREHALLRLWRFWRPRKSGPSQRRPQKEVLKRAVKSLVDPKMFKIARSNLRKRCGAQQRLEPPGRKPPGRKPREREPPHQQKMITNHPRSSFSKNV